MIFPVLVFAATIDVTPDDDLWAALQALQAGDELVVHAGNYKIPGFVHLNLQGSEAAPIVVRGAEGELAVIEGIAEQNTIDVEGSWYTFRDLEIAGGSHGVRVGTSDHATFENLHIHHTGDVAISCNRPQNTYQRIIIRGLHVHDTGVDGGTGEGMYLGCNGGECKVFDSIVEFNWVHDTTAGSQGDGIELKAGSYATAIRHNVIHDVRYPGITIYGTQGMSGNVVEGNAVWNTMDNGIQTVGEVIVRNNLVANAAASGIAAKPSDGGVLNDLTIIHNTVVGAGDACLRGNELPGGAAIVIANNAFYCDGGTAIKFPQGAGAAILAANAVAGAVEGAPAGTVDGGSAAAALVAPMQLQFYPAPGSPLIDTGEPKYCAVEDFNCLARHGVPDIGAYEVTTPDNPGWMVGPGSKKCAMAGEDETTGGDASTGGEATEGGDESAGETAGGVTGDATGDDTGAQPTGDAPTTDAAGSSGDTPDSASATDSGGQDDDGGCGCRDAPGGTSALLLGLLALLPRRRR